MNFNESSIRLVEAEVKHLLRDYHSMAFHGSGKACNRSRGDRYAALQ